MKTVPIPWAEKRNNRCISVQSIIMGFNLYFAIISSTYWSKPFFLMKSRSDSKVAWCGLRKSSFEQVLYSVHSAQVLYPLFLTHIRISQVGFPQGSFIEVQQVCVPPSWGRNSRNSMTWSTFLKGGRICLNKSNGNSCSDSLNNFVSCSRRSERALQSLQFIPQNATSSSSENRGVFCFADLSPVFLLATSKPLG